MKDFKGDDSVILELVDLNECWFDIKWKILEWRNREDIREWMDNRNIISEFAHSKWLDNLIIDRTQKQFVVFANNEAVGVVGFKQINHDHKICYEHIYMAEAKGIAVRSGPG